MVTVALIGILAAMAAPSFIGMIKDRQLRTAAEDYYATFRYARAEAIRSSKKITVQANHSNDWSEGAVVSDAVGAELRVVSSKSGMTIEELGDNDALDFNGKGYVDGSPIELKFCNERENSKSYQVNVFGSGFATFKSIEGC